MNLEFEFKNLWEHFSKNDNSLEVWNLLNRHYKQPNRKYHNLNHIYNSIIQSKTMLSSYKELKYMEMAIFFHDIIYKHNSLSNEKDSAEIFTREAYRSGFSKEDIKIISKLILATSRPFEYHGLFYDLMNDIDFSIFAESRENVFAADNNIRLEYSHLPEETWNYHRCKFLNELYDNRVFRTHFYNDLENYAKMNVLDLIVTKYSGALI